MASKKNKKLNQAKERHKSSLRNPRSKRQKKKIRSIMSILEMFYGKEN